MFTQGASGLAFGLESNLPYVDTLVAQHGRDFFGDVGLTGDLSLGTTVGDDKLFARSQLARQVVVTVGALIVEPAQRHNLSFPRVAETTPVSR